MAEQEAHRTLVKSPPELWAELSDVEALSRHLGELGEIRIVALTPETTVAWEGERASGTVEIEPTGWGTRVTLRAEEPPEAAPDESRPTLVPVPDAPLPAPTPLRPPPPPERPPPPPLPAAARAPRRGLSAILTSALDTLGGAAGNIRRRHATESPRDV